MFLPNIGFSPNYMTLYPEDRSVFFTVTAVIISGPTSKDRRVYTRKCSTLYYDEEKDEMVNGLYYKFMDGDTRSKFQQRRGRLSCANTQ
jgi:hypothetical protein